jgi:hypothetical protein
MAGIVCLAGVSAFASVEVPLQIDTVTTLGGTQKYAVGLYLSLGGTGSSPKLFQLDTGSGGVTAAYSNTLDNGVTQWWGSEVDTSSSVNGITEFGGRTVHYDTAVAPVTFYDGANGNALIQTQPVTVAQGTSATDSQGATDWQSQTEAGQPALLGKYYGNFGASLHPHSVSQGLFPVLAQMTNGEGNKLRGYVIHLGNLATTQDPTLTLYFDSDFADGNNPVADFTLTTSLTQDGNVFPTTGYATTSNQPLAVEAFEVDGVVQDADAPYSALADTGGTSLATPNANGLYDGMIDGNGNFDPDLAFLLTLMGTDNETFTLGFTTGEEQSINQLTATDENSDLNLGLALYNYYDVYFDAANSTMSFRALNIPEPSTVALLSGLGVLGTALVLRRRTRRA